MKYIINLIKYYYYMYKVRKLVPYDGIMESGRLTCNENSTYLRIDRNSNNGYYYRYAGIVPNDDVDLEEISNWVWSFLSNHSSVKWSYIKDEMSLMNKDKLVWQEYDRVKNKFGVEILSGGEFMQIYYHIYLESAKYSPLVKRIFDLIKDGKTDVLEQAIDDDKYLEDVI